MNAPAQQEAHSHYFLGETHARNERRAWAAITLTLTMMTAEIAGGAWFGSLAVVADGFHMATHGVALLIAALAYTYARQHANDSRFAFGTGKLGDLAGYTSAIILAMIALIIGYEAGLRLLSPVPIQFDEAIMIAAGGFAVNVITAWLLSGGADLHNHGHPHGSMDHASHEDHAHEEPRRIATPRGALLLDVFEEGKPPRFRLRAGAGGKASAVLGRRTISIVTERPGGLRQTFHFADCGDFLESREEIAEPHDFKAIVQIKGLLHTEIYELDFHEHGHHEVLPGKGAAGRDHNMRAAFLHVAADAGVSLLAILGLLLGRAFGWIWMDPVMGIAGALVIGNWAYRLIRDTGGILLDMSPGEDITGELRRLIESDGDRLVDCHVWRLGPGHLGAILSVLTSKPRNAEHYRARLKHLPVLSHVTIEVHGGAR
ncbi:MAG TPA: CDF family Co(II)/Ni(II) efflux transporter DmeF [Methylocella sp.]|nr:CDF family Co(II)/Ni(II) efflux transporter DmeF [Methylocella sp.]